MIHPPNSEKLAKEIVKLYRKHDNKQDFTDDIERKMLIPYSQTMQDALWDICHQIDNR